MTWTKGDMSSMKRLMTHELAKRFEAADSTRMLQIAEKLNRDLGEQKNTHLQVGGIIAINMGGFAYHPQSRCAGLGYGDPDLADKLDAVEAFYEKEGFPPQIDLNPYAGPEIAKELFERGFKPRGFLMVLFEDLDLLVAKHAADETAEDASRNGITVERVSHDNLGELAKVAAAGFGYPPGERTFPAYVGIEGTIPMIARIDGQAVACGAVHLHDGLAALYMGATHPDFRNRGCQTALAKALLRAASEAGAGAEIAYVYTEVGGASQRNMERIGFRVAYSKVLTAK